MPQASNLATPAQCHAEKHALHLIEHPRVRAAREAARAILRHDKLARTADGYLGLDRALDQWVMALTMRVINADPWRPKILWNVYNPPRHWFGHIYPGSAVAIDNPDNSNREISVDGSSSYEIHGRFGAPATQFMIEIVTDFDHYAGIGRTGAALTSQTIAADAQGRFTITVDSQPADGRPNHLRAEPGMNWLFMRDSMADWRQEITALTVARVAGPPPPPERGELEIIDEIVASMPVWVRFWCGFKDDFLGLPTPNTLVGPIGRPGGWGFLAGGRFALTDDTAVIVTTRDGGAGYTGFQISDPWTISPDPVMRLASLSKTQARPNPDGGYVYVLSLRDPGVHNWIDPVGLREGWMLLRWQGMPPGCDPAALIGAVRTVKLDDLATSLPPAAPLVDLAGRSAQIAARMADFAQRFIE